jgi:hypothetical protein
MRVYLEEGGGGGGGYKSQRTRNSGQGQVLYVTRRRQEEMAQDVMQCQSLEEVIEFLSLANEQWLG